MITDSHKQMLSEMDILRTAYEDVGSEYDIQQAIAGVTGEVYGPNTVAMRQGNTIFLINFDPKDKTRGMFRALNADTAKNYLDNSVEFIKAAGMAGFRILVSQFKDPSLLHIFKYISRNPPFPGMGYAVQHDKDKDIYQVTVILGQSPSGKAPKKRKKKK